MTAVAHSAIRTDMWTARAEGPGDETLPTLGELRTLVQDLVEAGAPDEADLTMTWQHDGHTVLLTAVYRTDQPSIT